MGTRKKSQPSYSPSRVVPRGCPVAPSFRRRRRRLRGSGLTLINLREFECNRNCPDPAPFVISRRGLHHDGAAHGIDPVPAVGARPRRHLARRSRGALGELPEGSTGRRAFRRTICSARRPGRRRPTRPPTASSRRLLAENRPTRAATSLRQRRRPSPMTTRPTTAARSRGSASEGRGYEPARVHRKTVGDAVLAVRRRACAAAAGQGVRRACR